MFLRSAKAAVPWGKKVRDADSDDGDGDDGNAVMTIIVIVMMAGDGDGDGNDGDGDGGDGLFTFWAAVDMPAAPITLLKVKGSTCVVFLASVEC